MAENKWIRRDNDEQRTGEAAEKAQEDRND